MKNLLSHKSIIVRFFGLYLLGLALFYIFWLISYLVLPEGILRGIGILGKIAGDTPAGSPLKEFLQIFILNLIGFGLIVAGNYILRVRYFSFGYLIPLAWMIMYAITLGTNSFSIPMEETMAPSLAVFHRSGLYEMMAGVLLAVATDTISVNKSPNFFTKSKPVPEDERALMKKEQWVAVAISILILVVAALREAYMINNL